MKTKFYILWLIHFVLLLCVAVVADAQVSGSVFRDINNDGVRQTSNPSEPWEYGVKVKAYDAGNTLVGTATTNINGIYSFSSSQTPAGMAVRIEFIVGAGDQPSKRMSGGKTNIQFVIAGPSTNDVDFAISSKKSFSDNANPYVATSAYTNGNALSSGAGSAGDHDNLLVFPYDLSSNGGATRRAANKHLGAVFGLGWQRESRTLLMSAYLKRHAGFGPGGIGAIYESQIDNNGVPTTPTMLLDVKAMGINVGTDPRTDVLPDLSNAPNKDMGTFAEVGKRGIGGIDLTVDGRELYIVNMYENKLHRIEVGNPLKSSYSASDVTGTWAIPNPNIPGISFHPMALEINAGKVYVGGVTTKETTGAHSFADTANLAGIVYAFDPQTNSFTEVLNFPLTHRRGFTNNDFRYEDRNNFWSAWQNSGDISVYGPLRTGINLNMLLSYILNPLNNGNMTGVYYSQPMLANIEFDADGAMILGIRDRFGDQVGYANLLESGNVPGELYRGLTTGEVLKAGKNGSTWNIESAGSVTNNGEVTSTPGVTDNNYSQTGSFLDMLTGTSPWGGSFGPGGGYFYYNHNFSATGVPAAFAGPTIRAHYVKSNGGLAVFPGYNEVMMTAIDPESRSFANGIIRNYNKGSNAGNMSGKKELIASASNDPSNMGKAAALGDLEILLDAEAMEIGNLIWNDGNGNGRQDAGETGIPKVTVVLRSPGLDNSYNTADDETWTLITDAEGHYYFDASIVNDARRPESWIGVSATNSGILPGFEYKIEIDPTQTALAGLLVVGTHYASNEIDSDGKLGGNGLVSYIVNEGGSTAATSQFINNYNVDFGFGTHVLAVNQLDLSASLLNTDVTVKWSTVEEKNVSTYYVERSVDGKTFTTIGAVYSKGNGNFSYQLHDDVSHLTSTSVVYRLRMENKDKTFKYSTSVSVALSQTMKLFIGPNPFFDVLNVQVSSATVQNGNLRIINLSGQTLYRKTMKLDIGTNSFTLNDFKTFSQGTYVVVIEAGQKTTTQKMIKR